MCSPPDVSNLVLGFSKLSVSSPSSASCLMSSIELASFTDWEASAASIVDSLLSTPCLTAEKSALFLPQSSAKAAVAVLIPFGPNAVSRHPSISVEPMFSISSSSLSQASSLLIPAIL